MIRLASMAAIMFLALVALGQAPPAPRAAAPPTDAPRFEAVDVYVDSGDKPLAAYQIELKADAAGVKAIGIEGGEAPAFRQPAYYDPAALHESQLHERIVLAAFSTGRDLPAGRTRVARVHVQVSGAGNQRPRYTIKLETAGTSDGSRIEAKVEAIPVGSTPKQPGDD
jgi:hypothetical protein